MTKTRYSVWGHDKTYRWLWLASLVAGIDAFKKRYTADSMIDNKPNPEITNENVASVHRKGYYSDVSSVANVIVMILRDNPKGLISEEIAEVVNREYKQMSYSGVTARYSELLRLGMIKDTGEKRKNSKGHKQRVLVAASLH